MGAHNLKAGLFYEYTTRPAARSSQFNGTFNFNRDTNNPLDTNHPFANALIGSVQSYSESTSHPDANAQFTNVEWFIQDNWRAAKNFTDRRRHPLLPHRTDPERRRPAGGVHAGPVQRRPARRC